MSLLGFHSFCTWMYRKHLKGMLEKGSGESGACFFVGFLNRFRPLDSLGWILERVG